MGKSKTRYVCQECGQESLKWLGRCPGCSAWNTYVEEVRSEKLPLSTLLSKTVPILIDAVELTPENRVTAGSEELDRVLGGGIVRGSFVLVGGDPGIGKSTLLLQAAHRIAQNMDVLYVSGEESVSQIKLRANRLGVQGGKLFLLAETNLDEINATIQQLRPGFVVIDSIQTVYCPEVQSAPGSVSQVRECAASLMRTAKENGITIFLVGHVTKDGSIAGPRVLEHMVDTVLYFEGDRHHAFRILRSVKNRFGAANEIGVFEMGGKGLKEINNPSELFLSRRAVDSPGSVTAAAMEGTRPILVEVQALACTTGYGTPRRMAAGLDYNRVSLLLAVLDKKAGYHLGSQDVYINLAGGVKIDEPALDLAVIAAVASSMREKSVGQVKVIIGELGLTGEVRGVPHIETRVKEAQKVGFRHCIIPTSNLDQIEPSGEMLLTGVATVQEALAAVLDD